MDGETTVTAAARKAWFLAPVLAVLAVLGFAGPLAEAQSTQRARTDNGREVILRPDGTWFFAATPGTAATPQPAGQPPGPTLLAPPSPAGTPGAPPNAGARTQPIASGSQPSPTAVPASASPLAAPVLRASDATTLLAIRRGGFRFWYSAAKWRPEPETTDGRTQLKLVGHDAFVVVIADGTPLPLAQLRTVALENARVSDANARIVREERRTISGREALFLEIEATLREGNTPATYLGYYFGDPRGNIQVIGAVARADLPRYRGLVIEALNGLDLNR